MTSAWRVAASSFLERGKALLPGIVDVQIAGTSYPAVRLTETITWLWEAPSDGDVVLDGVAVERLWSATDKATLVRTEPYKGVLAELQLDPPTAGVVLFPTRSELAFSERAPLTTPTPEQPTRTFQIVGQDWPRGALLFDPTTWRFMGFHAQALGGQRVGACCGVAELLAALESTTFWDEIAATHRLVRTTTTVSPSVPRPPTVELARAVRWDPESDEPQLTVRERRRALRGATLEQLRAARGDDDATNPEQRAIDRLLRTSAPFELDNVPFSELVAFATAARWFEGVVPGIPDSAVLERMIAQRRQLTALQSIVGKHFAAREDEQEHLEGWLAQKTPRRPPLVIRGPGGIGKSALMAHFLQNAPSPVRWAWLDFDRPDLSVDEEIIQRAVDEQIGSQTGDGTAVVVLDSFESSVQTYGYTALSPALDALARRYPDLGVLVGSRAPIPLLKLEGQSGEEYELAGLDADVAKRWLLDEGVSPSVCDEIVAITTVPLNLHLVRDLLKGKSEDEACAIVAELPKHLITGYLFRRVLSRLKDPNLGDLAPWAMVARKLTEGLLGEIGPVIGSTAEEGRRLFGALKQEVTLLHGDAELTIRADLRNTILPMLTAENSDRVRAIDEIAAEYWGRNDATNAVAAAEAVYHHLRLGNVTEAGRHWQTDIERHLRGYAIDEVHASSKAWLQSKLSTIDLTERVEDLLARGKLTAARKALGGQGREAYAVSRSARQRRVLGFMPEPDLTVVEQGGGLEGLESLVLSDERPVLRVRDHELIETSKRWESALDYAVRRRLKRCIAATGRLQLAGSPPRITGTATLVAPSLFLTTSTAVDEFVVGSGRQLRLLNRKFPEIEMQAEGTGASSILRVTRAVLRHPHWDIALLVCGNATPQQPVVLATTPPPGGVDVAVVGHPGDVNEELAHLRQSVYGGVFDVKRVMPGKFHGLRAELSGGVEVRAGREDSSTLSPDPGAPVFDVRSGLLLGVRFRSTYLDGNAFVPAWELALDSVVRDAGVLFDASSDAQPAPTWTSSWNHGVSARHALLDAYIAWRERDTIKADALLASLGADESLGSVDRVDRALLAAAVAMESDRMKAAAILARLIDDRLVESEMAREDVAVSRLRLVVDADAERELLELAFAKPQIGEEIVIRAPYRVMVPPRAWRRHTTERYSRPTEANGAAFEPSHALATRIQRAEDECRGLDAWISQHVGSLSRSFRRYAYDGGEQGGDIVAGLVAFPRERMREVNGSMLERRVRVAPHPRDGWDPIISFVRAAFDGASRGGAPSDLASWVEDRSRDGTLVPALADVIGQDTDAAWVPGLLHLLTPLPLESLLNRRFTQEQLR